MTYSCRRGIFLIKGNYNNALSDINKAIELKSDMEDLYIERASIYCKLGDYSKALID